MSKTDRPKPVPRHMKNCMRRGCEKSCQVKFIMCFDCWGQVPQSVRYRVWRAAQGGTRGERTAAVRAAIESLPKLETTVIN